jgi:hypothetical protein
MNALATILIGALCLTAARAAAQGTVKPGTPVGEVVVVGGPGPKVVSSFPAEASEVPAGTLVIKVVFDQPMAPEAWSYGPVQGRAFPSCLARPRLLADKRTSDLLCSVGPHMDYAIAINPTPEFVSADGRAAAPVVLHFTTGDVGVRSLHDALVQAGLSDADEPIMRWDDPGTGVSQSTPPPPPALPGPPTPPAPAPH